MDVTRIAVIGAGAMGSGIAQVAATSGFEVSLRDVTEERLRGAVTGIEKSLGRLVKAGKLSEDDARKAMGRISTEVEVAPCVQAADFVIEAIHEDLKLKQELFADLHRLAPAHAILATNTTQLSVTAIAAATGRPDRVIGMHWFNPPPVMRLIEIVMGVATSEETLKATEALSHRLGKETVVAKDAQGFITSRALSAHLMECLRIAEEGVASKEDIDKAIRLGLNYPMGPFELADYVGLDVLYHASFGLVEAFGDRHRAPQTLVKLVEAGHLGRKTGQGFYDYTSKPAQA